LKKTVALRRMPRMTRVSFAGEVARDQVLVLAVRGVAGEIQAEPLHAVVATGAVAAGVGVVAHVVEDAFDVVPLEHFLGLGGQLIDELGMIHAQVEPARVRRRRPISRACRP